MVKWFYHLLALAALLVVFLLAGEAERTMCGVGTILGPDKVPIGLSLLFRFKYCLTAVPLALLAPGAISSRVAFTRSPVAMACAAIAVLGIFLFASLMLATPLIALLPMEGAD